jgi:carbonic anhydrase/acetyltransferase-like protein (isoleucine patch superfamily)
MFAVGTGCWHAGCALIEHRGRVPQVRPGAYVAPAAVICGAVDIGSDARVLSGAVLAAGDGRIGGQDTRLRFGAAARRA